MFVAARIRSGSIRMTGSYVVIKVNCNGLFRQSLNGTWNIGLLYIILNLHTVGT